MTTQTANNKPTPPAPLDPSIPHHPDTYRRWQREWQAYHAALREEEEAERKRQQTREQAEANRVLSDDQYYALAVKRHDELVKKAAEREAAAKAQAEAEGAYFASLPDIAEVLESTEHIFLVKLAQWIAAGYEVRDDSIVHFVRGCYSVRLYKTAPPVKKGDK